VFESQVQGGQSGRGVSQGSSLGNTGRQDDAVGTLGCHVTQACCNSDCWALRASSRSTVFIISEGPVSAFFFCTVR